MCIVAWPSGAGHRLAVAPASFSLELARAIFASVEQQFRRSGVRRGAVIQLPHERLRVITAETFATGAFALAAKDRELRCTVILITHVTDTVRGSLLDMAANSASAIAMWADTLASRNFWRWRASSLGEELAAAREDLSEAEIAESERTRAVEEARALPPSKRFAGLGKIFARAAGTGTWLIALRTDHAFRIEAASARFGKLPDLAADGPMAQCLREQRPMIHACNRHGERHAEERFFSSFSSYTCLPFSHAAIALATNPALSSKIVARLERLARTFDPLVERWIVDAENQRLQELVRTLGLRMFAAIDNERQRIARDLHDDQAQLLTAARLTLETEPARARGILKQLDEALRKRVRELRPVALGSAKLAGAIGLEFERLRAAGIEPKLVASPTVAKISQQGQELCYQVLREAFSNVLRHAAAHHVTVSITSFDHKVLLTIEDDGVGPQPAATSRAARRGIGISGMRERLQLMGGILRLERLDGLTRLTAEIPLF